MLATLDFSQQTAALEGGPLLHEGLALFVKRECQTCSMLVPVMQELGAGSSPLQIFTQDDPGFPDLPGVIDDTDLEQSFHMKLDTVPTLIRFEGGHEVGRISGWIRDEWRDFTGLNDLGADVPPFRPGCGAKNVEPLIEETLIAKYGELPFVSQRHAVSQWDDEVETAFELGWTDGLPVVPPTTDRVWRMMQGTSRAPSEVIGLMPSDYAPCTVEKVAINAVMAGCKPEYLPVVIAAVEAVLDERFCLQGILATTGFAGPIVIVNGPVARQIGMNAGINVFGQGNRANATIGRALQLVIRNVGGGKPGGVDRAVFGTPGKYTFCFPEDEANSSWESLAVERGFGPKVSTVTVFAGEGVSSILDQASREPMSLLRSYAAALLSTTHFKLVGQNYCVLAVSYEHEQIFKLAGWSKTRLREELHQLLKVVGSDIVRGAQNCAEGMKPEDVQDSMYKFLPDRMLIIRAGGRAGFLSAILNGWGITIPGDVGSSPVTVEIQR